MVPFSSFISLGCSEPIHHGQISPVGGALGSELGGTGWIFGVLFFVLWWGGGGGYEMPPPRVTLDLEAQGYTFGVALFSLFGLSEAIWRDFWPPLNVILLSICRSGGARARDRAMAC